MKNAEDQDVNLGIARRKWPFVAIAAILLVAGIQVYRDYSSFRSELQSYQGLTLGASRAEALYRLGYPDTVLEDPVYEEAFKGEAQAIFDVDSSTLDVHVTGNKKRNIEQYNYWNWGANPANGVSLTAQFSKQDKIVGISCFRFNPTPESSCKPILGIGLETSEESLISKLGNGTSVERYGTSKTIYYDGLGLKFSLEKGAVYGVTLQKFEAPTRSVQSLYLEARTPEALRQWIR